MTTRMTPRRIGNSRAAPARKREGRGRTEAGGGLGVRIALQAMRLDISSTRAARCPGRGRRSQAASRATPRAGCDRSQPPGRSGVGLGLQNLAATIEAGRADVVAQVHFARGGLDRRARGRQRIVRTVHAALGGRLLVLLDSHFETPGNAADASSRSVNPCPCFRPQANAAAGKDWGKPAIIAQAGQIAKRSSRKPLPVILRAVAGSTPVEAFAPRWILRLRFAPRRMTAGMARRDVAGAIHPLHFRPAASRSAATLSVRSHENSGSSRPKWP